MFITEFDEDLFRKSMREEGYEDGQRAGYREGWQSGLKEGRQETLLSLVRDGLLDAVVAAGRLGVSPEELQRLLEASGVECSHGRGDTVLPT